MRRFTKVLLGKVVAHSKLFRLFLRNRGVVVLFHRVPKESPRDPIGTSAEEFESFLLFAKKYFRVISLSELVARNADGRSVDNCLVITFDDGYRENWGTAARLLEAHGLTATFFIASGFIGTDRVPQWDADGGFSAPWMTWDQVRDLRRRGFELGAHTVNHVDLGDDESYARHGKPRLPAHWNAQVSHAQALVEIESSKRTLEEELGESLGHFSFPFGRRENICDENRAQVIRSGFSSCSAAFGGFVTASSDPFDLARIPYTWSTPWEFLLDLCRS